MVHLSKQNSRFCHLLRPRYRQNKNTEDRKIEKIVYDSVVTGSHP
jgi:hypothetical protein